MKNVFVCIALIFGLSAPVAFADTTFPISTVGFGNAQFGMGITSVEEALHAEIIPPIGMTKHGMENAECAYATLSNMLGLILRFEAGRFIAIDVESPNFQTQSGLKVGDKEVDVINKLQSSPTYERFPNRYDDEGSVILIGNKFVVGEELRGSLVRFSSRHGNVMHIQAGAANYVILDEHDELCLGLRSLGSR